LTNLQIDGLHVIERMKAVLRELAADIRSDPKSRDVMLAEKGFSTEDIRRYGYPAAAAISAESPDAAIAELAAVVARTVNGQSPADTYGKRGATNGAPVSATEADEWDRLATSIEAQRDAMNDRTKAVSERMGRLARALRDHGHAMREQHTHRMAEAEELETLAANIEKKYSETVAIREPSKG
jgi:hypothetical protein